MTTKTHVVVKNEESDYVKSESEESINGKSSNEEIESSDDESGHSSNNEDTGNVAWADSIAKILKTNKPKGKKNLVLSKAKKITQTKKETVQPAGFQIEGADGAITDEVIKKRSEEKQEPRKKRKKEIPSLRTKPNILEKDRERILTKIATRGVVQLFNAVKSQQKDISNKLQEAGPLEVRKEKVLKNIDKRSFLDVLMSEKSQNVDEVIEKPESKQKESQNKTWNVLRDDFMMGAKLKDWDKELENEDEQEIEDVNMESE